MKLLLQNTNLGLIPVYDSDYQEKKKLKIGEVYEATIILQRNYEFLKKFMALIKLCFENLPEHYSAIYKDFNSLRYAITVESGYWEEKILLSGEVQKVAKSISFEKMDNSEFQDLYNKAIDVVIEITGANKTDLLNEIINFY
jgi:hypothetical protein